MKGKRISSHLYYVFICFNILYLTVMLTVIYILTDYYTRHPDELKTLTNWLIYNNLFVIVVFIPLIKLFSFVKWANYVEDNFDTLLIKRWKTKTSIRIEDIKYVSHHNGYGEIGLEFISPNIFGRKIYFIPENKLLHTSDVFNELKDRVYKAHIGSRK